MKKRSIRALVSVLIMAVIFITVPATVAGADEKGAKKVVRVGYYENEIFQEGASEDEIKSGYAYEYYRKLSEYTGWTYEYVYGGYNELYDALVDGKIDLLAGLAYKEERSSIIGYPDAIMGSEILSLVKHDSDPSITADPATMNGKRFGVLRSAISDLLNAYIVENNIDAEVVLYEDYQPLFQEFDTYGIDIMAAENDGIYGRDDAEVICPFATSGYYLCVNINRPDLLAELNEAQTQLAAQEPNYINSLRMKYYPGSISSRAFSAAEKEWLSSHHELRVGYLNDTLPYSSTDKNGLVTGMVKDILPKMLNDLGIMDLSVTYCAYDDYDAMMEDITNDKIDTAFPVGGGLFFSEKNGIYLSGSVSSALSELVYQGEFLDDTTSSFAVNENNRIQYYLVKSQYPDAEILYYPSIDECLDAVIRGEAKCTILNGLRAGGILKNSRYRSLSLRQSSMEEDCGFGIKIGNEGLLKLLNRGINVIGTDYTKNLAYRYADALYSYTATDFFRDHMGLVMMAILTVAAVIILLILRDAERSKNEVRNKEKARIELETKNRELQMNKEALAEALLSAENASKAKTEFLSNMSHDLRTPMNAILGFASVASADPTNEEKVKDCLSQITDSSRSLLGLIEDVLDMGSIESGKLIIKKEEFRLSDLIEDVRSSIQPEMRSHSLEFFIDTGDVVSEKITSDRKRLEQVLLNLLDNAAKYTPRGGTVNLRIAEVPTTEEGTVCLEFHIRDNGIGMSEEFREKLFDVFSRERSTTESGISGTGLGMAICKSIVEMMEGSISVSSKLGEGTEVVVSLPCRCSAESSLPYEEIDSLRDSRALVADHDTNVCLSVCTMLRSFGMRPDWTTYGEEAVLRMAEAIREKDEFKVLIIDRMLPGQDGYETVRRIRRKEKRSVIVIMLTDDDSVAVRKEALEAGADAICRKPVFLSELQTSIRESIGKNTAKRP